jgi:L-cysteine S-thiosulfotransferase
MRVAIFAVFAALSNAAHSANDSHPTPLTATPGDATRGRAIVADRNKGLCLLCHSAPIAEIRQQGDLAPSLAGAGARWSTAQLRMRIVDSRRINPDSIMPAYFKTEGLTRVGAQWRDKTKNCSSDQISTVRPEVSKGFPVQGPSIPQGERCRNQTLLGAQEIEDVVAYLVTLK